MQKGWVAFQASLEDWLPGNPMVNGYVAIDKCVEELTRAIQEATAASAPKCDHLPTSGPKHPQV
jgi:hypothetical protein